MASYEKRYTAFTFLKDGLESDSNDESDVNAQTDDNEGETSSEDVSSCDGESSNEDDASSENEIEEQFNIEDKQISILYRVVVDDIMAANKLRERTVDAAIRGMKQGIRTGHKNNFRKFPGIDFCKPENCCAYLRRYAICHTGLVKKLVWKFLMNNTCRNLNVKEEIIHSNHLKVVSLGGGPGNDLVGFCSALQEIPNKIKTFDLIVVDISKGWESVFLKILRKAKDKDFGSFSQCLRKKIMTGFMEADLTKDEVFKDKELSSVLGLADILLIVKVTSFLCDQKIGDLLHNVIDAMKPGAKLIFIDQPYYEHFFSEIECLDFIYHDNLKYKVPFKKSNHSSSIESAQAHIAIVKKKVIPVKDLSDGEET